MNKLELLKKLSERLEFSFLDRDGLRVVDFVGYDNESSKRKGLKFLGFLNEEQELKKLENKGELCMFFDDESMHFKFYFDNPEEVSNKLNLELQD
tara:strand:+ start:14392 stop:14676 length:285 start_codon:yes stop_codon:yes gene_type:complete